MAGHREVSSLASRAGLLLGAAAAGTGYLLFAGPTWAADPLPAPLSGVPPAVPPVVSQVVPLVGTVLRLVQPHADQATRLVVGPIVEPVRPPGVPAPRPVTPMTTGLGGPAGAVASAPVRPVPGEPMAAQPTGPTRSSGVPPWWLALPGRMRSPGAGARSGGQGSGTDAPAAGSHVLNAPVPLGSDAADDRRWPRGPPSRPAVRPD